MTKIEEIEEFLKNSASKQEEIMKREPLRVLAMFWYLAGYSQIREQFKKEVKV